MSIETQNNTNSPLRKFHQWWQQAKHNTPLKYHSAFNLSTIDAEGFPASRFVDLKDLNQQGFIFCTDSQSQKGQDIARNSKVSLCFWWDHIGRQIRIQGHAKTLDPNTSNHYWQQRPWAARITTLCSQQSRPLDGNTNLQQRHQELTQQWTSTDGELLDIPRPEQWCAYGVVPTRIEFLRFKESRLHEREVYWVDGGEWQIKSLQP